jgi:hypothetical protein
VRLADGSGTLNRDREPVFHVQGAAPGVVRVVVSDLEGNRASVRVTIEESEGVVVVAGSSFSPPLTPSLLSALPSTGALAWIEADEGANVSRSRWHAWHLLP